jgi:hypothetical protein
MFVPILHRFTPASHHWQTRPPRTQCVGGLNESFVTNAGGTRDGLVSDRSGFRREVDTYRLAVAARFLCLLSLRRRNYSAVKGEGT